MNRLILAALLSIGLTAAPEARDFREPFDFYDPLPAAPEKPAVLGAGVSELGYRNYLFKNSDYERFVISAQMSVIALSAKHIGAVALSYGSHLTAGSAEGAVDAGAVPFLLNTVQFEYALRGSISCGPIHCLFGYGRLSQHRLRAGPPNTGVDILSLGGAVTGITLPFGGAVRARGHVIVRNTELYDFWQSSLPEPRGSWSGELRSRLSLPLAGRPGYALFADGSVTLVLLREGGVDAVWEAELGITRKSAGATSRLFFYAFESGNTRMDETTATPALLLGIGAAVELRL